MKDVFARVVDEIGKVFVGNRQQVELAVAEMRVRREALADVAALGVAIGEELGQDVAGGD